MSNAVMAPGPNTSDPTANAARRHPLRQLSFRQPRPVHLLSRQSPAEQTTVNTTRPYMATSPCHRSRLCSPWPTSSMPRSSTTSTCCWKVPPRLRRCQCHGLTLRPYRTSRYCVSPTSSSAKTSAPPTSSSKRIRRPSRRCSRTRPRRPSRAAHRSTTYSRTSTP